MFFEDVADLRDRSIFVVRLTFNDHSHLVGAESLVGRFFIGDTVVTDTSPFLIARSIVSFGQLAAFAWAMAKASRELDAGSGPPSFADTAISRANLVNMAPFFAAIATLLAFFQPFPMSLILVGIRFEST